MAINNRIIHQNFKIMSTTPNPQEVKYLDPSVHTTFQDRIIVYADAAEEVTKGGIIIPDTVKEKPKSGIVVLVGPEVNQNCVNIGMHVTYGRFAGQETTIDGVKYDSVRVIELMNGRFDVKSVDVGDQRQKTVMTTASSANIF